MFGLLYNWQLSYFPPDLQTNSYPHRGTTGWVVGAPNLVFFYIDYITLNTLYKMIPFFLVTVWCHMAANDVIWPTIREINTKSSPIANGMSSTWWRKLEKNHCRSISKKVTFGQTNTKFQKWWICNWPIKEWKKQLKTFSPLGLNRLFKTLKKPYGVGVTSNPPPTPLYIQGLKLATLIPYTVNLLQT